MKILSLDMNKILSFFSQKDQSYRHDPLITHTFSKKELLDELSIKIRNSNIGDDIQIIVSGKIHHYKKVSQQKIKKVDFFSLSKQT